MRAAFRLAILLALLLATSVVELHALPGPGLDLRQIDREARTRFRDLRLNWREPPYWA